MTRLGVIGVGHWGPNLVRNFHERPNATVVAVADTNGKRLDQLRARFPDIAVTTQMRDLLGDPTIDAVVVATPTVTHYEVVKAALEAGKHVLVEKPITADARLGAELCELARAKQRTLMVGHIFIFNAAVRRVKQYLAEGRLGNLYHLTMVRTNLGPIRLDVNAAWDLATHDVSIANYWLGSAPEAVSAVGRDWINRGVEDAVFATLRYPKGVLVNLHASWLNPRKVRDITVVGDQRMLTFDDMNMQEPIRIYDKGVTDERVTPPFLDDFASYRASVRDGEITIPKVALGEPLRAECEHFLECVQAGKVPETDGVMGLAVVRTVEAMTRSMKNGGREEKVTP